MGREQVDLEQGTYHEPKGWDHSIGWVFPRTLIRAERRPRNGHLLHGFNRAMASGSQRFWRLINGGALPSSHHGRIFGDTTVEEAGLHRKP